MERTNAETELRLSDEYQEASPGLARQAAREPRSGGQVNLRRGRTISSRWHSMESLDSSRSQSAARTRGPANQQSIPVEVHRPRSRDSLGPKGFTSMVSLGEPRATSSPVGPPLPVRNKTDSGKRPLVKTESFPGLDAASVRSSCSCDTDTTTNSALIIKDTERDEGTPRPVTTDSKKTKIEYLGSVPIDHKATDLNNLQHPMKNLYFKSIEMKNMGHQQLPGTMEVSETGLKVNYIR